MLTTAQITALHTELTNDPLALGYAADLTASNWQGAADLLNAITGPGAATVTVQTVDTVTLQECVVGSEALLLSQAQQALWQALLTAAQGGVPVANANIDGQALAVWGSTTTTRANLTKLLTRTGSRAEVLFGIGTVVGAQDIYNAR